MAQAEPRAAGAEGGHTRQASKGMTLQEGRVRGNALGCNPDISQETQMDSRTWRYSPQPPAMRSAAEPEALALEVTLPRHRRQETGLR